MIFDVPTLIASLSSTMTLRAGSVILTGTPHGVGFARTPPLWLKAGDSISVELEKIGTLTNPVAGE
jgi:2-keto-4-pentenoate hydratase/2-oxohepta-3-ene-1,7-dioic acid hydratase in catechol pathway